MDYLQIKRVNSLHGNIKISGAKNASLPLIAMTILAQNSVSIKNLPHVADINTLLKLLSNLGAKCDFHDDRVVVEERYSTECCANHYREWFPSWKTNCVE